MFMDRRAMKEGVPSIDAIGDPDLARVVVHDRLVRRFGVDLARKWWDYRRQDLDGLEPSQAWNQAPLPRSGDLRQAVATAAFFGYYDEPVE